MRSKHNFELKLPANKLRNVYALNFWKYSLKSVTPYLSRVKEDMFTHKYQDKPRCHQNAHLPLQQVAEGTWPWTKQMKEHKVTSAFTLLKQAHLYFTSTPHSQNTEHHQDIYLLYLFSSIYSKYPRPWSSRGLFTPLFFSPGFCSVLASPVIELMIYFYYST